MKVDVRADFYCGRSWEGKRVDCNELINALKRKQRDLQSYPIDTLSDIFDEFGKHLANRNLPIHNQFPGSDLAFIAGWCRKANLIAMLESGLSTRRMLDEFVCQTARSDRAYQVFPKGLAVHWMAGNVPTLGLLSLICGILTKNANLIKVASDTDDFLAQLLCILADVRKDSPQGGRKIARTVAVIRYDRSNTVIGAQISREADVRIFWGSDDAVHNLRKLPAKLHSTDLVFANKTSLMVIDAEMLKNGDMATIARRVATDISVFEQKACASPHTLFLESTDDQLLAVFAQKLKRALENILRTLPKLTPSPTESTAILNLRAQYDMFHNAWYSEGLEYSILHDDLFQIGPPIGNRTLFLRRVDNLEHLTDLITADVQTIGIFAPPERYETLTALYARQGVHRFARIGLMTHFELPWDGYMLSHNLVRWVSRPVTV
jgi:hypothetical protein